MDTNVLRAQMDNYRQDMSRKIAASFDRAEKVDRAESFLALLKHGNLEPGDSRDTLQNMQSLSNLVFELIASERITVTDSLQLQLLLYCHFFEWSELFDLFYDLAQIERGQRAGSSVKDTQPTDREKSWAVLEDLVSKPFTEERFKNAKGILSKIDGGAVSIDKKISTISFVNPEIGDLLRTAYDRVIRNGFSHNNYVMNRLGLLIRDEAGLNDVQYSFEDLNMKINRMSSLMLAVMAEWRERISKTHGATLAGAHCKYRVEYINKRFRLHILSGSLPIKI